MNARSPDIQMPFPLSEICQAATNSPCSQLQVCRKKSHKATRSCHELQKGFSMKFLSDAQFSGNTVLAASVSSVTFNQSAPRSSWDSVKAHRAKGHLPLAQTPAIRYRLTHRTCSCFGSCFWTCVGFAFALEWLIRRASMSQNNLLP